MTVTKQKKLWGFKIIKDNVETGEDSQKGRVFRDYQGGQFRYRALDDDNEVYYYFLSDIDPNKGTEGQIFCMLDWARYYAGAAHLQYKDPETGEYDWM